MEAKPAEFESIGNRLGFRVVEDDARRLKLSWQGPRFPAFLCLGIAILLLFVSVPIGLALWLRGFSGAAGALWYFPIMNLILLAIALYLTTQKRAIVIDGPTRTVTLTRKSLHRVHSLSLAYGDIENVTLGIDQVYSGFAVAGSSAAQTFPVPSLRLTSSKGESILIDRGSARKLKDLGAKISERVVRPLAIDPAFDIRRETQTAGVAAP